MVVELYGHGRSPAPDDPDAYTAATYVDAFEQVRRELGAEQWFLCGHSLGAALTLNYTLTYPERVLAHVFMNANSALADDRWLARTRTTVDESAAELEAGGREAVRTHRMHPRRGRAVPAVREAMTADAELHDPVGLARSMRLARATSVRDRLAELRPPGLLVVGVHEAAFAEAAGYAAATLPDLEVVELDAGHGANVEDPEGFNRAVVDFLSRQGSR